MSALLDSLLDAERLADLARNDAAAGFPPAPPVELDEAFFARSDLAMLGYKAAGGSSLANDRQAHLLQISRPGEVDRATWARS